MTVSAPQLRSRISVFVFLGLQANSIKNMKTFQTEENEEEAVSEAAETAKTSAEEESGEGLFYNIFSYIHDLAEGRVGVH